MNIMRIESSRYIYIKGRLRLVYSCGYLYLMLLLLRMELRVLSLLMMQLRMQLKML